jgi:DNA-directed RNA polymerase specialized sigma24 family protein
MGGQGKHEDDKGSDGTLTPSPGGVTRNRTLKADVELNRLVRAGDTDGALRHLDKVHRHLLGKGIQAGARIFLSPGELEEAYQELIKKLLHALGTQGRKPADLLLYAWKAAVNQGVDVRRKKVGIWKRFLGDGAAVLEGMSVAPPVKPRGRRGMDVLERKDLLADLQAVLENLPPRQKLVLAVVCDRYEDCLGIDRFGKDSIDPSVLAKRVEEVTKQEENPETIRKTWDEVREKLKPILSKRGWEDFLPQESEHERREGPARPGGP